MVTEVIQCGYYHFTLNYVLLVGVLFNIGMGQKSLKGMTCLTALY